MHNINEIRKRNPKFFIATTAIITAVMLLGTTAISTITTTESVFAYEKNQATSQDSACGNGFEPTNIGCQNTDSQIQGDENTVALTAQQTFPSQEPPPEPQTCEECFDSLTSDQRADFERAFAEFFGLPTVTIEELCAAFAINPPQNQRDLLDIVVRVLLDVGVDQDTVNEIEECIEDVFGIPTPG